MGLRGPKPKDEKEQHRHLYCLYRAACDWAQFFYTLRDGEAGCAERKEFGPWEEFQVRTFDPDTETVTKEPRQTIRIRSVIRTTHIEAIEPGQREEFKNRMQKIQQPLRNAWVIWYSVTPAKELWDQFTNARALAEHRRTVSKMKEWWKAECKGFTLSSHVECYAPGWKGKTPLDQIEMLKSEQVFDAKNLWLYPHGQLRKNDDDRIRFFAKAAAGIAWGIAPATAMRRLTGMDLPNASPFAKYTREYVEHMRANLQHHAPARPKPH